MAPYDLADMVCVRRQTYDVACNWKVYVENFMDYYHTPTVHQASLAGTSLSEYHRDDPVSERGTGEYMLLYGRHEGSAALLEDEPGLPRIATLSGRAARGSSYVCIFPCALIACTIDCVWYVEIHPAGPDRIRLALGACFPKTTASLPDFASRLGPYIRRWDVAVAEDNAINELQQRGISSPFAAAGRVCRLEALSHTFRNWVLDWAIDHPS